MNGSKPGRIMSLWESLPYLNIRQAGYLGLLSLAFFIVCWMIGAFADEDWVIFENNVCHLGVSEVDFVRIMYPISCTLTGIGIAIFGYSVGRVCDRRLERIGYYLCLPLGVSLIAIGLIDIDTSLTIHMVFVYSMCISAGIAIGFSGIEDAKKGNWLSLTYLFVVLAIVAYLTIYHMEYQQFFALMAMFFWLTVKCCFFITKGRVY